MANYKRFIPENFNDKMYILSGLAIIVALILTAVSILRLCSEQCSEGHNYLLFGMHFEIFGLIFLITVGCIHLMQRKYTNLLHVESLLFASAFGAELMFIIIQKYYIGKWCPVCLGIAACITVGMASFASIYVKNTKTLINNGKKGEMMNSLWRGSTNTFAVLVGFFIAFMGVTKHDAMQAAQDTVRDSLAFGHKSSNIEVYLFSDWACPACRKLEPSVEEISDAIIRDAKLIFVDHVVHPETLNYIPYHLSFMLKNKGHYFELREMLTKMSEKTGSPTEEEISAASAKLGVDYSKLNYSDIALAIKYYKKLGEKFKIQGTPTMVIINSETKKGKKLTGNGEITKNNALKAIKSLQEQ